MVGSFRSESYAGAIVQPEPPLFLLLLRNLQPFAPPNPFDPLVVHTPASVVQQARHHAVAIAPVLVSQLDDVVGQALFIDPALRHFPLRGPMLSKRAAGPALRHAKFLPNMVNALAAT